LGQGRGRGPGAGPGQGPAPGRGPAAPRRGRSVPGGPCRDGAWSVPGSGPGPTRDQGVPRAGRALAGAPPPGAASRCPAAPAGRRFRAALPPRALSPRKEKKVDNVKPKHPDEQEIPFRLRELIRSREAMKCPDAGTRRAAEKKQQPKSKGPEAQGDIPVPKFRRGKGESERSYVCRMEQEVQRVLFLTKNQLQRQPEKEVTAPEKSKRKKEFQNKKLEKARKKKEEKKEAMLEKSLLQDTVAFGEVVTQPPAITSWPRGRGPAEQAGRKRLFLTPHLGQSQASPASRAAPVSMARRRIMEEERARVIQAYRDIQRRKQQQREAALGSIQGRCGVLR
ncbi:CC137 protein, partial [Steatornis caripensis]|nr:CC137 protein [Steatornis caripensis]